MASRSKISTGVRYYASTILLSLFFSLYCFNAQADDTKVKYKADNVSYEKGLKKAKLTGNVEVIVEEVTITGEEIEVDLEERVVYTTKPFVIKTKKEGKDTEIVGKSFNFNIDTKRLVADYASLETDAQAPGQKVFISGEEITVYNKGERISIVNGDFTTCDFIDKSQIPHYSLKAATMDFIPNDRVIAWNTVVYIMGGQTFWYPFWYIPLKQDGNNFNIDAGKNEVEGMFVNFRNYYNLNDYHDGTIFAKVMEKKWLGLGLEHTWLANPTSESYIFAYGNPLNSRYFLEPNADLRKNIGPAFEDRELFIHHEQWFPFLPYADFDFSWHDRSFYNVNSIQSPRDNFDSYKFDFSDKEIFQPFKDFVINFTPNFQASYEQRRDSNIDKLLRIVQTGANNSLNFSTNTSLNFNEDIKLNLNSKYSNTIRQNLFNNTSTTTTPTGTTGSTDITARDLSYYKSGDNIDFTNNLSLNYNILPNLSLNSSLNYNNNDIRNFTQPAAANLPSVENSNQTKNQQLNSKLNLAQGLSWGNLSLNVEHRYDFLDADIFPKDSSGNILPDNQLSTVQKTKRDEALNKRKSGNYINKLPELNLTLDPFFKDIFPVTLSGSIGRYEESNNRFFDPAKFSTNSLSSTLIDLVRTEANLNLDSKDLDLGLGNKVNFGGSGYQQRFYQTQDAQYSLTGQLSYRNDLLSFFTPRLNYTKVITDAQNNTPFSFDKLSRNKQDLLRTNFSFGNIPEFTFNLSNIGYDYENKVYLSPLGASLSSDFVAGAHFVFTAQSGYRLNNVKKEDLTRTNPNFSGIADKEKLKTDASSTTITDAEFAKKYVGATKQEALADVQNLSDTDLTNKYAIDNRLYDVLDKEVIDNTRLKEADLGRLELRGGRLEPINLSIGVGTPWTFGLDDDFGKENIPWGLAGQLSTNIDLQGEDLYKKEVNGKIMTITPAQSYANLLNKFQNSSLGALFVIGGNWVTHTHIELNLTLIPPEFVPEGQTAVQTNRPFFPFNTSISIKKDLHDFILSFDLQNQYVPAYNKVDFMFSLNLEMTAFPFSTRDITGATKNLSNLTNKIDQIQ
jgi:lipopolysaccharide export system protein LptA